MKRFVYLVFASILGFLLAEYCFALFTGYPKLGIEKFVYGFHSKGYKEPIYHSHSRYLQRESNYHIFVRNNLGLTGMDVLPGLKHNIGILGSSYIEAQEINPGSNAVSILNTYLHKFNSQYQAINLGRRTSNPTDCLYRLCYFKNQFSIKEVVLVVDDRMTWQAMSLETLPLPDCCFYDDKSFITRIVLLLGNHSSIFSIIERMINRAANISDYNEKYNAIDNQPINIHNVLRQVLSKMSSLFPNKLTVISIMHNPHTEYIDKQIMEECNSLTIPYYSYPDICIEENLINSNGHLNNQGNKLLGNAIYHALQLTR